MSKNNQFSTDLSRKMGNWSSHYEKGPTDLTKLAIKYEGTLNKNKFAFE